MLKKLLYIGVLVLFLVVAYHLTSGTAQSQTPSRHPIAMTSPNSNDILVIADDGNVYGSEDQGKTWLLRSNVFVPKSK